MPASNAAMRDALARIVDALALAAMARVDATTTAVSVVVGAIVGGRSADGAAVTGAPNNNLVAAKQSRGERVIENRMAARC